MSKLKQVKPAEAKKLLENTLNVTFQLPDDLSTEVVKDQEAKRIVIPASMDKLEAARELEKQWENEEQVIDVNTTFEGYNWKDALVAIKKVTEKSFGWISGITRPATFFSPESRPKEIDVVVDVVNGKETTEKAFFGEFRIACYENAEANISVRSSGVSIAVKAKKKYSEDLSTYYNSIREYLAASSIYRAKNVVITGRENPDGEIILDFEIIENKGSDLIVLNHDENVVIENFIKSCMHDPGKKCYLFTGPYGNGKTETAMSIGRFAVQQHNMSFFYLKDSKLFDYVLNNLKKYQPAVLFVEDIDEIASGTERDARMNAILNTLDGVQTKGNNLTVILTTNHENKINPALRRPGRIDLIVKFSNPDKETVAKIFQAHLTAKLPEEAVAMLENIDFNELAKRTPDVAGAVIAEIASRAVKLYRIQGAIDQSTVDAAIVSMKHQIELMKEPIQALPLFDFKDIKFSLRNGTPIAAAVQAQPVSASA